MYFRGASSSRLRQKPPGEVSLAGCHKDGVDSAVGVTRCVIGKLRGRDDVTAALLGATLRRGGGGPDGFLTRDVRVFGDTDRRCPPPLATRN